jgi:Mg2+-importing ATPase
LAEEPEPPLGGALAGAFWSEPADAVVRQLASSPGGLTAVEATARRARLGANVPTSPTRGGTLRLLVRQFASPIPLLLGIAAILSIGVGEVVDGGIILAILVVSGLLGFWQERRAANAVEELLALVRSTCMVMRDGRPRELPVEDIVPGDVVQLRAGSSVPGDAILLEAKDLFVDEAALTGESYPAEKTTNQCLADAPLAQRTNMVFLGTHVVSGTASALVVRTGPATEFGAIARRLALRPAETEFERGVRHFGYLLLYITLVLVIVIFAVNVALHRPVLDSLLFTLALAVGLTPQLLPAIVSVTLAQGAREMARQKVIVRRLAAIEDLGGMAILCTDKTGTITEGTVAVHATEDWTGASAQRALDLARVNASFATGFVNPIDDALRGEPAEDLDEYTKLAEVPYDFVRKRLSIACARGGQRLLITKGALTNVLDVCDRAESASGEQRPLDDVRTQISARYEALSRQGYRCLGVAYCELPSDAAVTRDDERNLIFVGIISLSDPLKASATDALRELADLGVQVKLITGDNRHVAAQVASDAGLAAGEMLTGSDLHGMTATALFGAAPRVSVFAEIEPNQKERIILALKKAGFAVGFLGDGINDASALHAADVGISVDSAADVTKQAADVVLLEKDLHALCRGVREGRRAFANTLKYVFITTSANFGNMVSMAGASFFAAFLPMLPKQILLLNVLTDLPAMAIAGDRLDPELVATPRRWDNHAIRRFMLTFGLVSSVFDYMMFGTLLLIGTSAAAFRTAWFLESVLSELLILLVIRTRRVFFRSTVGSGLLWASVGVALFTVALPYLPFARDFGFEPLSLRLTGTVIGVVVLYVAASEVVKRYFYRL